ncbi:MAG: carbon storage regulator CsrA [Sulfurimonas sp.]|nr:carbon storage regulator CsrA [Sulfurimonas sp.]
MLVLARKIEESIIIGDDIVIKVISIEKGVVKLGIDAPKSISIVRSELLSDVKDLNIAASKEVKSDAISLLSKMLGKKK